MPGPELSRLLEGFRLEWVRELERRTVRFGCVDRSRLDYELALRLAIVHQVDQQRLAYIIATGSPNAQRHRHPEDYARRTAAACARAALVRARQIP